MTTAQILQIVERDVLRLMRFHDELVLTSARYRRNIDRQVAQAIAEITDQGRLLTPGPRMVAVMNELERALVDVVGRAGSQKYLDTAAKIITKRASEMNKLVKRLGLPEEALIGPDVTRNPRYVHALDRISTAMSQGKDSARMQIANSVSKYKRLANTTGRVPYKQMLTELKSAANIPARYVGTVANTSLASMDREMRQDQATRADIQKAKYVGPLDSVTRAFCSAHLDRVESWQYWEQTRNDVGPNPPSQYGGGWNCRHALVPWLDEWSQTAKPRVAEPAPVIDQKIGEALTREKAIEQTQSIVQNAGITIKKLEIDSSLSLEQMNSRNRQLDNLFSTYRFSDRYKDKTDPVTISMISRKGAYGYVDPNSGRFELNFGHRTDPFSRTQKREDMTNLFQMPKSLVDADKADLATLTHEFAHVISIQYDGNFDAKHAQFFKEMKALKTRYSKETKSMMLAGNRAGVLQIYLGDYANTNTNEFMAEGFTEYKLSSKPSKYAKLIGELIDKYFKK